MRGKEGEYEVGGVWYPVTRPLTWDAHCRGTLLNAVAFYSGDHRRAAEDLGLTDKVMNYKLVTYDIPRAGDNPSVNLGRSLVGTPKDRKPPVPHDTKGWARRAPHVASVVWHYFETGVSICPRHWTDGAGPYLTAVAHRGLSCPHCVELRTSPPPAEDPP